MFVISPFLTEKDVIILHREKLLQDFADSSKKVVLEGIYNYLNNPDGDEEVKTILKEAYKDKLSFRDVQKDEEVLEALSRISALDYYSINSGTPIDDLYKIRTDIDSVYKEENMVPYVNPINKDLISQVIGNLLALYRVNKNTEYKRLALFISKNKPLFVDKPNSFAKGTVFKNMTKRSKEIEIISRGVDFLIEQKRNRIKPESWRIF